MEAFLFWTMQSFLHLQAHLAKINNAIRHSEIKSVMQLMLSENEVEAAV